MPKAIWNGEVIAESDTFEEVEGNIYFPPESLKKEFFQNSEHTSLCGWKGKARYFHVVVGRARNENAAWTYPSPKEAAKAIEGHVAFWRGVRVERD